VLASTITTLMIMIIIIIPVSFTSYIIVDQIPKINKDILEKSTFDSIFEKLPFKEEIDAALIKNKIDPDKIEQDIINATKDGLSSFGKKIISFGTNTIELVLNFFLMMYIIFFGLKDGKKYMLRLGQILPLGDKTERRLFKKFSSIVRSIFKGTLIVSLVQGSLAGFLFYLVGFQGILIWTTLLIISAMIPAVGVGLIIFPAALYLFFTGAIMNGVILIVGLFIISLIDNILRPYLIGHETEIPDIFITISILAGLSLIGVTGLVIGPVIAGFYLTMWNLFEEKYHDGLDSDE